MNDQRVLFITYNFPPHGGPGVQRSIKFIKYLPQFKWYPWVVTSTADASPILDHSLEKDIPAGTPIYRVGGFSINNLFERGRKYQLDRLVVLLNLILQIPDPQIFWSLNTREVISKIINEVKPHLVYTTSGPYSTHLIGQWVKQKYQLPWFADFRDPWSTNLLVPYLPGYRRINQILERRVLQVADRVACVSDPWMQDLQNILGSNDRKFITITNGYDDEDIEPIPLRAPELPFTITHFGSFYKNRKPELFLKAVSSLIEDRQLSRSDLRIIFIGKNSSKWVPYSPPYEVLGYVDHDELNKFRNETDVYLLILDSSQDNHGNFSGKLFEYIASNRPVLAIAPENGVAQNLIEHTATGVTVAGNIADIRRAIMRLFHAWQDGFPDWQPKWDIIGQYTRKNLTARLADAFYSLI